MNLDAGNREPETGNRSSGLKLITLSEPSRKLYGNCKTKTVWNWHDLFRKTRRSFLEGALYSLLLISNF